MLIQIKNDEYWMRYALAMAQSAAVQHEIPVGAIVVLHDQIIGYGWNNAIMLHDPSAHAEIIALRRAGKTMNNYRLSGATLYVTLEPCTMCAGAIIHSRLQRLVYAASDYKTGAAGSFVDILNRPGLNHYVQVTANCLSAPCSTLISDFFRYRRLQQKKKINNRMATF